MFVLPWCPVNVVLYTAVFVIYVLFTLPNKLRLRMHTALASAVVAVTFANDCVVGAKQESFATKKRYTKRVWECTERNRLWEEGVSIH